MENITFVSVLGNSRFYDDTNYIFKENQREVFRLNHWYASHALLTYLKEKKSQVPNRILVLYPNTPEGVKSFEIGWESDYTEEGLGRSRKAIKDLFKENFSDITKSEKIFDEIMGLRFMEDLEIELIKEDDSQVCSKNLSKKEIILELNLSKEIITDLQNNITHVDSLSNEKEIIKYSVKMIEQTDNSLILISNDFLVNLISYLSEYAYHKKYTKFMYIVSADLEPYGNVIKSMTALGNIKFYDVKFDHEIYIIIKDFKEILIGRDFKSCIIIKDESIIKRHANEVEKVFRLEKSLKLLIKESFPEVEENIFYKEQESHTSLIYEARFQNIYLS